MAIILCVLLVLAILAIKPVLSNLGEMGHQSSQLCCKVERACSCPAAVVDNKFEQHCRRHLLNRRRDHLAKIYKSAASLRLKSFHEFRRQAHAAPPPPPYLS